MATSSEQVADPAQIGTRATAVGTARPALAGHPTSRPGNPGNPGNPAPAGHTTSSTSSSGPSGPRHTDHTDHTGRPGSSTGQPLTGKEQIVLLNFGGPRSVDEVFSFLYEILRDPNTIQLPAPQWLQNLFAWLIARRRAPEISQQYGEIGGRSPIVEDTERIAAALARALEEAGCPMPIRIAQRYLVGWTQKVARDLAREAPARLLALPLYPHFTYATTGSSLEQLHRALVAEGYQGQVAALRSYPTAPGYLEALSAKLQHCLEANSLQPEGTLILCSAHGLPRAYVDRGDPYLRELEYTVALLRERFAEWEVELSFQSRVGPAEWLKPYTDQFIPGLPARGVRRLVFVPISFVNDHIETLYEIGYTYFELARSRGIEPYRCDAVSDHPAHVGVLAQTALRWAGRQSRLPAAGAGEPQPAAETVPLAELLPPSQAWRRGRGWLVAALLATAVVTGVAGVLLLGTG